MSQHDDNATSRRESLFSRWSRRKQGDSQREEYPAQPDSAEPSPTAPLSPLPGVISEHDAGQHTHAAEHDAIDGERRPTGEPPAHEKEDQGDQPVAEDDDTETPLIELPDPDTLTPDADISAFMQSGVDPALRQRALRRIFMGGEHSVRDGLDDYDQDFSKMRPLAEGVADTLRNWTRKVEEGLEKLDETSEIPRADTTPKTDDQIAEQAPDGEAQAGETQAAPRDEILESPDPQAISAKDSPQPAHAPDHDHAIPRRP